MEKLDSKMSSAQIVVASIDDLLIEILLCLPLKPLVRFKSVSKHWNSIISDPKFHTLHNRKPNPAVGLIWNTGFSGRFAYDLPFDKSTSPSCRFWYHRIKNSCNGLLVCGNSENNDSRIGRCYVLNPTTMNATLLPKLDKEKPDEKIIGMFLAFDPSKSPHHYKVVCVFSLRENPPSFVYRLEVYSSKTGSWEKRGKPFTSYRAMMDRGVHWNGAIHWLSCFDMIEGSLYFNPDTSDDQTPRIMPMLPRPLVGIPCFNYVGESCDHLHYVDHCKTECVVYEMQRDYSEWFVKYRVDLSGVFHHRFSVCTLVRGDKDCDSFLVLLDKGWFIRLNLVHKTFENLHKIDLRSMGDITLSPHVLSSFLC